MQYIHFVHFYNLRGGVLVTCVDVARCISFIVDIQGWYIIDEVILLQNSYVLLAEQKRVI